MDRSWEEWTASKKVGRPKTPTAHGGSSSIESPDELQTDNKRQRPSTTGSGCIGPSATVSDRIGPSATGNGRIGPSRTGSDRNGPSTTGSGRNGLSITGSDRNGPSTTGNDRNGPPITGNSNNNQEMRHALEDIEMSETENNSLTLTSSKNIQFTYDTSNIAKWGPKTPIDVQSKL